MAMLPTIASRSSITRIFPCVLNPWRLLVRQQMDLQSLAAPRRQQGLHRRIRQLGVEQGQAPGRLPDQGGDRLRACSGPTMSRAGRPSEAQTRSGRPASDATGHPTAASRVTTSASSVRLKHFFVKFNEVTIAGPSWLAGRLRVAQPGRRADRDSDRGHAEHAGCPPAHHRPGGRR